MCGRIRGYQFGTTSGFLNRFNQGIDGYYVVGVSMTHGGNGSRQHIWTFAAGLSKVTARYPNECCPCDSAPYSIVPEMITFVRVVFTWNGLLIMYSIRMMSSGMVRTVHPPVHAVSKDR